MRTLALTAIIITLTPSALAENSCLNDVQHHYTSYTKTLQSLSTNALNNYWDIRHIKKQLQLLKVPETELPQRILSYVMHYNEQQRRINAIVRYHVDCSVNGKTAIFEVNYIDLQPENSRYLKINWNKDWKITLATFSNDLTSWGIAPEDLTDL